MVKAKEKKITLEDALVPISGQPYEVPDNWCWTTLGTVAKWSSGGTPSRKNPKNYGGDVPWVKTGELEDCYLYDSKEKITEDAIAHSSAKIFPKDSILIAMYGATIGKTAILGISAATNQACACAQCKEGLDNKFIFYYLRTQKEAFINKGKGGAQPNISQDIIKNHPFALPPLAEQQRIVKQIESLFAKLDEAKEKVQSSMDKAEINKSAILQSAFDGKLTRVWRDENGIAYTEWKEVTIGDVVCNIKDKHDPLTSQNLDIPYIGLEHIEKGKGICSCGSHDEVKSLKTLFKKGDLLYGKLRPYLDKHDVAEFDGMCSTDILVYRADSIETAKYMNYLLGTIDFVEYAMENSSGINLPRTSEKAVSAYKFKISCEDEQMEIVRLLENLLEKANNVIEKCEKILQQIDLMKKSILAKAFRGELGTNNPEEESSIELLKQIIS